MNKKLITSLKTHPVRYAHMLGFTLLGDLHNDWIRSMICEKSDYTLLGHRGSYKTTCLSIAFALLIVLRPNKTIFFIRKTDDDVIEIINQTNKILQSDLFKYIVSDIYGVDFTITSSSSFKINTNLNSSTKGQVQLMGMGINGSLTGKHADYVFTDDIVNIKDRVSRAEREHTKLQYQELQNIKNRGGRIFNTGTPWHKDDCISTKMTNIHKYTCYDTGLITTEQLKTLRESMSPSLFSANYELKHIADSEAMFTNPQYDYSETAFTLLRDGVCHIDASYGGADYTAFTAMKQLPDGRIIAFGKMWQKHVDMCLNEIKAYHDGYMLGIVALETNGDKGYLKQELENDYDMYVHAYSEKMNKFVKISTYLRKNWNKIYWIEETDHEYLDQILDFTEYSEHDDAPDSAASLLRYMQDKPQLNTAGYLRGGI